MHNISLLSSLEKYNIPQDPYADYLLSIYSSTDLSLLDKQLAIKEVLDGLVDGADVNVGSFVDEVFRGTLYLLFVVGGLDGWRNFGGF